MIVPVTVHKCSSDLNPKASPLDVQLLEPCLTSHSQQKGLHVARTLVDVKEHREVPLRVFNVSNEAYHLAAATVVTVVTQHVSLEQAEGTLPEPLQELLGRSTEHLTVRETERLHELLYNYQHVFSFSNGDLGTKHMVEHRIETGSVPPIREGCPILTNRLHWC